MEEISLRPDDGAGMKTGQKLSEKIIPFAADQLPVCVNSRSSNQATPVVVFEKCPKRHWMVTIPDDGARN